MIMLQITCYILKTREWRHQTLLLRLLQNPKRIFIKLNVRIVAYSSFLLNYHFKIRKECFIKLASVVQRLDSAIHRINLYPVDSAISFPNTYPLDSDLSGG